MNFIDTNVLIYHLGQPDHEHGPRSSELFARLWAGTEVGFIGSSVIIECIHAFRTRFDIPVAVLADNLIKVLAFPGVRTDQHEALVSALQFWREEGPLSFVDCYHLALTKSLGMDAIYTFDRKMDRYPGVAQVEP